MYGVKSTNQKIQNLVNKNRQESWSKMDLILRIFKVYLSVPVEDHWFSTYVKLSEKLIFLIPWYAQMR